MRTLMVKCRVSGMVCGAGSLALGKICNKKTKPTMPSRTTASFVPTSAGEKLPRVCGNYGLQAIGFMPQGLGFRGTTGPVEKYRV